MKRLIILTIIGAICGSVLAQNNVVQVEYFLDADPGFGTGLTTLEDLDPESIEQNILANIPPETSLGYHKLYFRVSDDNGNWSHTVRKHIEVYANQVAETVMIGEYFLDEDPTYGNGTIFTIDPQQANIEQQFEAAIATEANLGYHKLYGRVQDANGVWSQTFRKHIQVYLNTESQVVEVEYFFAEEGDDGFGVNSSPLDDISSNSLWTVPVPYSEETYSLEDVLFVRVKDSQGRWSITTILDEIDETLGVPNVLKDSITVYPNPFQDQINIETPKHIKLQEVFVVDVNGKIRYRSNQVNQTIDLSYLTPNMYILILKTDEGDASFKLIKN